MSMFIPLTVLLHSALVFGQQVCDLQLQDVIQVKETDPAGTKVFNVSALPGVVWSFNIEDNTQQSLMSYLDFTLDSSSQAYVMKLARVLDLEYISREWNITLNVILLTLQCKAQGLQEMRFMRAMGVAAVNEFPPSFNTTHISIQVNETTPVGHHLLQLIDWSRDNDVSFSVREINGFVLTPSAVQSQTDSEKWLFLSSPYDGTVTLKTALDFDSLPGKQKYLIAGLVVKDTGGLSGTATLTVHVLDEDDLPPSFYYPGCAPPCLTTYSVTIGQNVTGPLPTPDPGPIVAHDGDALAYNVTYHFVQGPDNYEDYLSINSSTGEVTILSDLKMFGLKAIVLLVEAREVSPLQHSTRTTLLITVEGEYQPSPDSRAGVLIIIIIIAVICCFIIFLLVASILCWKKKYQKGPVHPQISHKNNDAPFTGDNSRISRVLDQPKTHLSVTDCTSENLIRDRPKTRPNRDDFATDEKIAQLSGSKRLHCPPEHPTQDHWCDVNPCESTPRASELFETTEYAEVDSLPSSPATSYHRRDNKTSVSISSDGSYGRSHYMNQPNTKNVNSATKPPPPGPVADEYASPLGVAFRGSPRQSSPPRSQAWDVCRGDDADKYLEPAAVKDSYSNRPLPIPSDVAEYRLSSIDFKRHLLPNGDQEDGHHTAVDTTMEPFSSTLAPVGDTDADGFPRPDGTSNDLGIDIYDGTKDYQDLEISSGFYTDSARMNVKRAARLGNVNLDPNDSQYWTIVHDV